jgi:hypothetical protein
MRVELDAREIPVVTHTQVATDPEIAERILCALDLTQTLRGDGRTIR